MLGIARLLCAATYASEKSRVMKLCTRDRVATSKTTTSAYDAFRPLSTNWGACRN